MWKEVLAAAIGVLGIGVLFNVRGKNLILSAVGGGIGWLVYKIYSLHMHKQLFRNMCAKV